VISIVLYGRNDNYGYNLHKRAALSLNCMAEVLTDQSDEIIFVDYNTPDDFPTFPEAIQDTLTCRAKKLLRIFRVRPEIHQRFKSRTHLLALEPIARNVAIRRSSSSNRWILSTNTDMIFVPLHQRSLSEIASELPSGFYHAPRIELPEALWECLDRSKPSEVLKAVREWGSVLHLNEIVMGSNIIRYDAPGDFQLLLRSDLIENQGFDEDMLLGWHVDSNIAARMLFKYKEVGDFGQHMYGYHCDHTRQVTPMHSHIRVQNDLRRFVAEVNRADVPAQATSWGCADDAIEEVRLSANPSSAYVKALRETIGQAMSVPTVVHYTGESYNKVDYDARHLLPFLTDMFVSMPRTVNVAWYGARSDTLRLFANVWSKLNFVGQILVPASSTYDTVGTALVSHVAPTHAIENAQAFVFDFGGLPSPASGAANDPSSDLRISLRRVIRAEQRRISQGSAPRRIIGLNAIGNEYEFLVCSLVGASATPFATHMRHGFALPVIVGNLLPRLANGEVGLREGAKIRSDSGKTGRITNGSCGFLDEGIYLLSLKIEPSLTQPKRFSNQPCLAIELLMGAELLALHLLRHSDLEHVEHSVPFLVSQTLADGTDGLEIRIAALRPIAITIQTITIEPSSRAPNSGIPALLIPNWLPVLQTGSGVQADEDGIVVGRGDAGFAVWGPYWALPAGDYELIVTVVALAGNPVGDPIVTIDVVSDVGQHQFAARQWRLGSGRRAVKLRLPFTLSAELPAALRTIETRVSTSGQTAFRVRSIKVRQSGPMQNWLRDLTGGGFVHFFRGMLPTGLKNLIKRSRNLRFSAKLIKSQD
jgi:hypothetical protein